MSRLALRGRLVPRLAMGCDEPSLPTYQSVAAVLERQNGSGLRLVGWTLARSPLIIAPMIAVGVDARRAIIGGLMASSLISLLALGRVSRAAEGVVSTPTR